MGLNHLVDNLVVQDLDRVELHLLLKSQDSSLLEESELKEGNLTKCLINPSLNE